MIIYKIKFRIAYFYFFLLVMALSYGVGLIRSAYNYREADLEYSKKEIILQDNASRLSFSNGYITMRYGKAQFTENNGLACFFAVKGVTYTTFKAIWKIENSSPEQMRVVIAWPGIPIKQIWHLRLKDEKLDWKVELESNDDITINHIGVVFFFKDNYRQWISPYEQGTMPVLNVFQQRQDVNLRVSSNVVGLSTSGEDEKLFPAVGLKLGKGVFLNEVLVSICRDMFSGNTFSSISLGGIEPLRVFKNRIVYLSSGEISLFDTKDDLSKYIIMR